MAILSQSDLDSIRKTIDTRLTVHELPDETIQLPQFLPLAESRIQSIIGTATITPEIKAATIYLAASYLAGSVNLWTSISLQGRDENITVPARSNLNMAVWFKEQSDKLLEDAGFTSQLTVGITRVVYDDAFC